MSACIMLPIIVSESFIEDTPRYWAGWSHKHPGLGDCLESLDTGGSLSVPDGPQLIVEVVWLSRATSHHEPRFETAMSTPFVGDSCGCFRLDLSFFFKEVKDSLSLCTHCPLSHFLRKSGLLCILQNKRSTE